VNLLVGDNTDHPEVCPAERLACEARGVAAELNDAKFKLKRR
jgi:hypothetical protein